MTDTDVVPAVPAAPVKTPPEQRRRAWTVTALLVVFMMVNFADKSVLGLAADPIREDLGLSASAFGLANSAFFLLFSICGAAVGLLADRVRPKWLLLTMAVLWSLSQAPLVLGGGLAVLVASRVLLGAAEGPAFPVAQQTTLSWFPNHRRNLPGALIVLGITLGVLVAAPVLTWVIHEHGWRTAVAVVAVAGAVWALLWIPFGGEGPYAGTRNGGTPAPVPADGPGPGSGSGPGAGAGASASAGAGASASADRTVGVSDADPTAEGRGADRAAEAAEAVAGTVGAARGTPYRRILATRTWIGATAAYFGTYWVIAFCLVWLPSYLHDGLGYSSAASARLLMLVWGLSGVVVLGQAALTGWLLRRGISSRRARGGVGGVLMLVGAAACLALPAAPAGAATVVLLVAGFGCAGAMGSVAATTVAELAPADRRGGALGIMNAVVTTAGLIAPTLIGHFVDTQGTAGYRQALLITGVLLVLGGMAAVTLIDPARDARLLSARRTEPLAPDHDTPRQPA
ncbi:MULTISPECIES: MFS transporter [unclassified Streptomyces]|uniref:MFS transporter n=1 Tax=unclassified Streptomyces TaxID=2593676 RepID=UPI00224FD3E1|nr:MULTISPECIES: MFS transporter [unclassified Streptomyces]MCX4991112.1 MFS transporter [Streptomyces sp. NBC_00568]MCX5003651.1 MFS transporter [Streptomyces sp. NBC_00638]